MRQTAHRPVVTLNKATCDSRWDEGRGDRKSPALHPALTEGDLCPLEGRLSSFTRITGLTHPRRPKLKTEVGRKNQHNLLCKKHRDSHLSGEADTDWRKKRHYSFCKRRSSSHSVSRGTDPHSQPKRGGSVLGQGEKRVCGGARRRTSEANTWNED